MTYRDLVRLEEVAVLSQAIAVSRSQLTRHISTASSVRLVGADVHLNNC